MRETPERVLARARAVLGTTGNQPSNAATVRLVLRRVLFDGHGTPAWRSHAACTEIGPEPFYPDPHRPAEVEAAKRVCRGCPVRVQCLTDVLGWETGRRYGVVGGLSAAERGRLAVRLRDADEAGGEAA